MTGRSRRSAPRRVFGRRQTGPVAEVDAISFSAQPASMASLTTDLRALGVRGGTTVMVHAALSSFGYIAGGAHAVVLALLDAVGDAGTLIMPTH